MSEEIYQGRWKIITINKTTKVTEKRSV